MRVTLFVALAFVATATLGAQRSPASGQSNVHGAEWLEAETQNVNVPACRFYERMGFVLREVHPNAYPGLPDEVQLLWYKRVREGSGV